jgi:hypothetical protein
MTPERNDEGATIRFFLGGDRYLLGDDSLGVYLYERGRSDQPLQRWPNTVDGRIAAKNRLRELDDNVTALHGTACVAVDVMPTGESTSDDRDVVEAEIVTAYGYGYGPVLGCPRCSTVYWLGANEWREICTQCGAAPLVDADALLVERETRLKGEHQRALEGFRNRGPSLGERLRDHKAALVWSLLFCVVTVVVGYLAGAAQANSGIETVHQKIAITVVTVGYIAGIADLLVLWWLRHVKGHSARQQQVIDQTTRRVLFDGITFGPFSWYLSEQYNASGLYGRRLTRTEAMERVNAIASQQQEAAEAQRRRQFEAGAALAFLSISSQLHTIEYNQPGGF